MTFREKPITRLYAFAMAAVFALVLAGCGGGGGGSATAPVDPTTPAPDPRMECEDAGGRYNADGTCTSAEDLAAEEAEEMAKAAAATKAAGTKETAIANEAKQGQTGEPVDAGLGGSADDGTAVDTYSMEISRDRTGTTVKIEDSALAGDDDPKFMQAMDLGGGTTMHARAMAADDDGDVVEEVVIVSTDIEAPTAVAFAKFEDATGTATQALTVRKDGVGVDADNPADSFDVSAATSALATRVSNIMAAGFASSGAGELTYPIDDATTEDKDEAFETAGTYNGAAGTYRCAAASGTCSVTYDAEGKIDTIGTDWIFTPAEGATSDQPDYDYYHYGFWLKKTTDADGVTTYNEVETFAGSSIAAPTGDVTGVTGSAEYAGGAVGVYVKNVYNSDRTLNMATSGHFTADVSLTATFGQVAVSDTDTRGTIAENLLNTLSGTIDNFTLSGSEENSWSVALKTPAASTSGTHTGTAEGGGDNDGLFSATFYGSVAAVDGVVPKPSSVVGEFNASFTNGSVAGAFGARKMDE